MKSLSPNDDARFPTMQLFLLALVRVTEPIALTSIFPYAWPLVESFHIGQRSDTSFYAGLLIAAFTLSEALTSFFWGSLSDRIGRKPVVLIGCTGTVLSLLIVGFSTNFWIALLGRVVGGLLNGNIGVLRTMVGELVTRPEHEAKAYAVLPFVWNIGSIIGPAIGGTLADPSHNFQSIFSKHGLFAHFPYLLPNLVCAAFLLLSILIGYFYLQETHPNLQSQTHQFRHDESDHTPLLVAAKATITSESDPQSNSYSTFEKADVDEKDRHYINTEGQPTSVHEKPRLKAFTWQVWMLVVALGFFDCHTMAYNHLLPIFLQDNRADGTSAAGGLGLSTKAVGLIMSVNGFIALFIQGAIFPVLASRLGIWKIFVLVTSLHPLAYFIVPYLTSLPKNLVYPGIYMCLTIRSLFCILVYPAMLILLKQASPAPSLLGKINGLSASAAAACRTIAPPLAGILYGVGMNVGFSGLAWWGSGFLAILGAIQLWFVPRNKCMIEVGASRERCGKASNGHREHRCR